MYRDNEKTMSAGRSTLGGTMPVDCPMVECSKVSDVLENALGSLRAARMNAEIIEGKLYGMKPIDQECAKGPASELPIESLAYQLRDLAILLSKLTASIETRL